jgi:hypothetical protein
MNKVLLKILQFVCFVLAWIFGGFAGGFVASSIYFDSQDGTCYLRPVVEAIHCKRLVVDDQITVGKGDRTVGIVGSEAIAGVWVIGPNGRTVSIYDTGKGSSRQTALGIYFDRHHPQGLESALSVDKDGAGYVQLKGQDGKFIWLPDPKEKCKCQ